MSPRRARPRRPPPLSPHLLFYARVLDFPPNGAAPSAPPSPPTPPAPTRGGIFLQRGRCKHPLLPPHHPRPYARGEGGIMALFNVRAGMPLLPRPCRQVSSESYIPRDTWYCPAGWGGNWFYPGS